MKILANTLDKNTIKSQKNKKKFFANKRQMIITGIGIILFGIFTLLCKSNSKSEIKTNISVKQKKLDNQNRKRNKYKKAITPSSTKKGNEQHTRTKSIQIPQTQATLIKTNEKLQQNIDSIKNNLTKINVILHSEECIVHNGNEHIESHEFNDEFLQDILDKEIIIIMFNSKANYKKIVSYCNSVDHELKQVSIDDKIIANMLDQTNELHTRLNQLYDNTIGINECFDELKKKKESGIISSIFNLFTSTNEDQNIEYIQDELTDLLCATDFTASVKEKKCLIYLGNNLPSFIS